MTSALTPGDIVEIDFGLPRGSEAGMVRPAIVVTAARILGGEPNVVQVVPLTRTLRVSSTEVRITPDVDNGLGHRPLRSASTSARWREPGSADALAMWVRACWPMSGK